MTTFWHRGDFLFDSHDGRKVYSAFNKIEGVTFQVSIRKSNNIVRLKKEIQILSTLDHPNLQKVLGFSIQDGNTNVFVESVFGESLSMILEKFSALPEKVCSNYCKQICSGLRYLHRSGVCLSQLSTKNVFLEERGKVQIVNIEGCILEDDFVKKKWKIEKRKNVKCVGLIVYELLFNEKYDEENHLLVVVPPRKSCSKSTLQFLNKCLGCDKMSVNDLLQEKFLKMNNNHAAKILPSPKNPSSPSFFTKSPKKAKENTTISSNLKIQEFDFVDVDEISSNSSTGSPCPSLDLSPLRLKTLEPTRTPAQRQFLKTLKNPKKLLIPIESTESSAAAAAAGEMTTRVEEKHKMNQKISKIESWIHSFDEQDDLYESAVESRRKESLKYKNKYNNI